MHVTGVSGLSLSLLFCSYISPEIYRSMYVQLLDVIALPNSCLCVEVYDEVEVLVVFFLVGGWG